MATSLNDTLEIPRQSLNELAVLQQASICDVRHLSSYNWFETEEPTIAVPGCPALWNPSTGSQALPPDEGWVFIAQNTARHPDYPLEPIFRALYASKPSYNVGSVDVVSDHCCIQNLLAFVDDAFSGGIYEDFDIRIEMVRNTLIMSREEKFVRRFITQNDRQGCEHGFKRNNTTQRIGESTGHYRIISYRFAGLKFLIRHETDAYIASDPVDRLALEGCIDSNISAAATTTSPAHISLSNSTPAHLPSNHHGNQTPSTKLKIREGGWDVSREATVAISVQHQQRRLPFTDLAPELWISQTPQLVRACHQHGVFKNAPVVENVADRVMEWEGANKEGLKKLAALICRIIEVGKRMRTATLRYNSDIDMLVMEKKQMEQPLLPEDLYGKWRENGGYGSGGLGTW